MVKRALKFKPEIDDYSSTHHDKRDDIKELNDNEWKQIRYLHQILQPFNKATRIASSTNGGVTIYLVFHLYEILFGHLDDAKDKLEPKTKL